MHQNKNKTLKINIKNTHREKHRQIKLQSLEKVRIWAFGLSVH